MSGLNNEVSGGSSAETKEIQVLQYWYVPYSCTGLFLFFFNFCELLFTHLNYVLKIMFKLSSVSWT